MSLIEEKVHLYTFIIARLNEMKYVAIAIALAEHKAQDLNDFAYNPEC
jgi:hypothetical protein